MKGYIKLFSALIITANLFLSETFARDVKGNNKFSTQYQQNNLYNLDNN